MIAAVSTRILSEITYHEIRDGLSHDLSQFLQSQNITPLLIPNIDLKPKTLYSKIPFDILILSGGGDLITKNQNYSNDYKETTFLRDNTESKFIKFCLQKKIPIITICRGMQLTNLFFGGNHKKDSKKTHVNSFHNVTLTKPLSFFPKVQFEVNSFHNNLISIDNLAPDLLPLAFAEDNTVEAFIHKSYPIIGTMWHPERNFTRKNIEYFFKKKYFISMFRDLFR